MDDALYRRLYNAAFDDLDDNYFSLVVRECPTRPSLLYIAVALQDVDLVRRLVAMPNAPINEYWDTQLTKESPLGEAVRLKNVTLVTLLLHHGADIQTAFIWSKHALAENTCVEGATPLGYAVGCGQVACIDILLAAGLDPKRITLHQLTEWLLIEDAVLSCETFDGYLRVLDVVSHLDLPTHGWRLVVEAVFNQDWALMRNLFDVRGVKINAELLLRVAQLVCPENGFLYQPFWVCIAEHVMNDVFSSVVCVCVSSLVQRELRPR